MGESLWNTSDDVCSLWSKYQNMERENTIDFDEWIGRIFMETHLLHISTWGIFENY